MKNRAVIIVIVICLLGICVSAFVFIRGEMRSAGVFAGEISVNTLENFVERGDEFVVYFYGRSCEDCAASEPYLTEALAQMAQITAYKCEREANATVRSLYGVEGTPTLIYFARGEETARLEGPLFNTDEYIRWLQDEN